MIVDVSTYSVLFFSFTFFFLLKPAFAGIQCHYCGVKGLCKLPYDPSEAEFITCPKSCLKFDGFADGNKVIVRDCGVYEADECTADSQYENTKARGMLCHCMGEKCNGSNRVGTGSLLLVSTLVLIGHKIFV